MQTTATWLRQVATNDVACKMIFLLHFGPKCCGGQIRNVIQISGTIWGFFTFLKVVLRFQKMATLIRIRGVSRNQKLVTPNRKMRDQNLKHRNQIH